MKSNELRIGNYISDIYSSNSFMAKVVRLDFIRCYYGMSHSSYSDLRPIPLTPEILEKCGAEKYEEFGKSFMELSVATDLVIFSDETGVKLMCLGDEIKKVEYLHDLQNLYFALTNNELEIKI